MVNTRNTNLVLNTPPPTDPIQAALAAIQETLANIQAEVRAHSTDIDNLKKGAGTSQPRTDELTVQQRPHPEPNNTPYGKLIRIEFPKFSGDDVKDWVYRCKQFFKVDGVPDGRKIQLASMHMFDTALVWYQQYVKRYPDNTLWEHFEVEVVKRFGVLYDDPIMELKNLKQTGSVQNYQEAFEALLNRVDLPEPIAVSMFIGGLKPEVGTPMRMFQANNLCGSYQLARMQEATNTILKPRYNTHLLPTPKQSTTTFASKAVTTPVKSNSVGQSSGYVTRNRGDIDNYIDGDDDTYEDCMGEMVGVTDTPQIILNALFGLNSYQTMRIMGRGATLGDMQCNFKKLIMKFNHKGRQLVLRGMNNTHVHWMQGKEGMLKQAELSSMALCVYPVQLCQMEIVVSVSAEVEQVLTKFDKVFEVPKDLPPQRSHDHQIPLMQKIIQ
ncbi:putative mitochondrial protein [Tanacetum coccineum]|uniref:Mitochondrial protein n=1 Tax=Tanacetum coccineum TaxID=301880 RepID=A0ABQ5ETF7_9ASTR